MLDSRLVEPGPLVYVDYLHEDGNVSRFYTSSTGSISDLSDDDLDSLIADMVQKFPNLGHHMIDGHLKHLGHCVPHSCVQVSYLHIHGPPVASFGQTQIQHRVYSVLGPNSLWHHNGQHGLFFSIVILNSHSLPCYRSYSLENCHTCFH